MSKFAMNLGVHDLCQEQQAGHGQGSEREGSSRVAQFLVVTSAVVAFNISNFDCLALSHRDKSSSNVREASFGENFGLCVCDFGTTEIVVTLHLIRALAILLAITRITFDCRGGQGEACQEDDSGFDESRHFCCGS